MLLQKKCKIIPNYVNMKELFLSFIFFLLKSIQNLANKFQSVQAKVSTVDCGVY